MLGDMVFHGIQTKTYWDYAKECDSVLGNGMTDIFAESALKLHV